MPISPVTTSVLFQSAPLTDVRGDKTIHNIAVRHILFQSAPLTDVRGDAGGAYLRRRGLAGFNPLPSRM